MRAIRAILVALVATIILTAVATAGPNAAKQRVAIDMKFSLPGKCSARSSLSAATATSKIAFISEPLNRGYVGVLYVMNADGSGKRKLSPAFKDMRWAPDGQKIAFSAWSHDTGDLYVMYADGTGRQALTSDPGWDGGPTWSPDGRALAYTAGGGFYVINADGTERRMLTSGARGGELAWSPVGDKIAFVNERGGDLEIHIMNPDGSGQRALTRNSVRDSNPVWSPDGRRIAFESNWQVWVMNADGSGKRRLTRNGGRNFAPAWSPDGRRIAFEHRLGREKYGSCSGCGRASTFQVYVVNADGTGERMLAQDGAQPFWSPDGRKIAFERKSDIYVMNADGSGQRNLTRSAGRGESLPVWSPARKK